MALESKYPEHAKMKSVQAKSQVIGEFLDWLLHEKKVKSGRFQVFETDAIGIMSPVELAIWKPVLGEDPRLIPYQFGGIEKLLADYFGIDWEKMQEEKDEMFRVLREGQKK